MLVIDPMRRLGSAIVMLIALTSCLCGCFVHRQDYSGPEYGAHTADGASTSYALAVHPLFNPVKLFKAYQPLVRYLNARMHTCTIALEASRDYGAFEEKYRARKPDLILANPWQTVQAMKFGYHVIAMAGEPSDFRGILIVRVDSGIERPVDLKGKTVSYPAPTALAACIMPQWFLHRNGIDVNHEIVNRYVGSQESSIMNVYLGLAAAGATWPPPWRAFQHDYPQEALCLRIAWETESLINNSVMARDDLPATLQVRVRNLLAGLAETEEGKVILQGMETARFITSNDSDYDIVRTYISRFEGEVRSVE
ncbi:MAG TPA: PhnD/SsuA/transferrin family substrate-binding protein [bacterium]|nr:PhnD/SsuA/transferrin family substrate-binding protein [bacterium]